MPSKLGFQLHEGVSFPALVSTRPRVLVGVGNPALLDSAYEVLGAGPVYVYRRALFETVESYLNASPTVAGAVDRFLLTIENELKSLRWAYHQSVRVGRITPQAAQFEALAVKLAAERYGVRLCLGNFATGTPAPSDWATYRPVLEAAERYQAIIGLAERYPMFPYVNYGPNANLPDFEGGGRRLRNEIPYPQGFSGPGEWVGRYRHLRDYCRANKLPVRLLISEAGAGRVLSSWLDRFGPNLGGWKSLTGHWRQFGWVDPAAHYLEDLVWLDQHVYGPDPEVIGVSVSAWNNPSDIQANVGDTPALVNLLKIHADLAQRDQGLPFQEIAFATPENYRVITARLRVRAYPSMNTKTLGTLRRDEVFSASHYTFHDGWLWLKHRAGWSAYAPLVRGNPDYDEKYVEGRLITTPRQDAAVNNFVGAYSEVRAFMQAYKGSLFYISINPDNPPQGARQFSIVAFPPQQGRRIIDQLHPAPGDPPITPGARNELKRYGQ
jgi:hypothetical protein